MIDGCPAGIDFDETFIQSELDRRRPGQGGATTARKEEDRVNFLSGVFEGRTAGTPIGFMIANKDQRSRDYSAIKDVFRPGHADMTYQQKYGLRDYRGGGRASARETACRVAAGGVAQLVLRAHGIALRAGTTAFGGIATSAREWEGVDEREFFATDPDIVPRWTARLKETAAQGDSLGGVVEVVALGCPAGLGEPVFDKLDARLAYALMGVGAVKGVEIGSGFAAGSSTGSRNNDGITPEGFSSNNAGGILGGISNGDAIVVRATVKPIPSISIPQSTVTTGGEATTITVGGRHDLSAIPRIVPVLKAMTALVLADALLQQRARR